jgi:hypothetical protein
MHQLVNTKYCGEQQSPLRNLSLYTKYLSVLRQIIAIEIKRYKSCVLYLDNIGSALAFRQGLSVCLSTTN